MADGYGGKNVVLILVVIGLLLVISPCFGPISIVGCVPQFRPRILPENRKPIFPLRKPKTFEGKSG